MIGEREVTGNGTANNLLEGDQLPVQVIMAPFGRVAPATVSSYSGKGV